VVSTNDELDRGNLELDADDPFDAVPGGGLFDAQYSSE